MKFKATKAHAELIEKIVERAHKLIFTPENDWKPADQTRLDTMMDVTACHLNGCALDLEKLLGADDFTFVHDVCGIRRHLNRETGVVENCFLPRCHAHDVEAAA